MDHVTDLRMEPRDLCERGIRFVKVPATMLLRPANVPSADIHPADLSDLLGRYDIDLIAERIEAEAQRRRPARIRRALWPGLPVFAAAAGAPGGAADAAEAAEPRPAMMARATRWRRAGRRASPFDRAAVVHRSLAALAGRYDVVLCDVWGVIHNGVEIVSGGLRGAVALPRRRRSRRADHERAPAGRGGGAPARPAQGAARLLRHHRQLGRRHPRGDGARPDKTVFHLGPERDLPIFEGLDVSFVTSRPPITRSAPGCSTRSRPRRIIASC